MNFVAAVLGDDDIQPYNAPPENIPRDGTDLIENDTLEEYGNSELLTLGNIGSQVQYTGTFNDVNVKYALSSVRVKEDIVIQQPSDIKTFAFVIRCDGLTAQKNEDNTVSFIDESNDNQEVFVINAPYMSDATDECSSRVRVDLQECPDGYIMTYTPDSEWMNDAARVYPVTIDPDVTTSTAKANISDTYVKEYVNKNPNKDYYLQKSNYVGTFKNYKYRTFLKFENMPRIPVGSKITSAKLKLNLVSGTTTAQRLSFYKVKSSWTSTNVTWNFSNSGLNVGDSSFAAVDPKKSNGIFSYSPSITSAVQGWYNCNGNVVRNAKGNSYNYGFMIRYANLNESGDYNLIASGDHNTASMRPSIAISYTGSSANPAKPGRTIADGTYFIRNMNSGKYLDVLGSGTVNKSSVGQYDFTGCTNQQWRITYESDGYYRISPVHASSKALDMQSESSSRQNGTTAWIYDYKPTVQEQKWLIHTATGGGYEFITKPSSSTSSPKALEIANSSKANGAKAQIWTSSKSRTNDNWVLREVSTAEYRFTATGPQMNIINPIINSMKSFGYNTIFREDQTARQGYDSFPGKGIVIAHGHSGPGMIRFDQSNGTQTMLYATQQSTKAGEATISNYASGSLSSCDLFMFLSCNSGNKQGTADSLVEAVKKKGAKVVIGFTVSVARAENYTRYFMKYLEKGYTIQAALTAADQDFEEEFDWYSETPADSNHRMVLGNTGMMLK